MEPVVYPGLPVIGSALEARRDLFALFTRASRLGDVVEVKLPGLRAFLLTRPELVERVLHDNYKAYGKQTRGYAALRKLLGNGLLTSEGSFWLRQRRLAQPAFHRDLVAGWGAIMVRAGRELAQGWSAKIDSGLPFDVHEEMMRVTLRVVGEALLTTDVTKDATEIGASLDVLLPLLTARAARLVRWPDWLPTRSNRTLVSWRRRLDRVVFELIAERRKSGAGTDLLGMLMSATDADTGERMDDRQLRDEVLTILLAGHETTANALSWAFVALAKAPQVEARLRAELGEVLQGREPIAADAAKLPYTSAVLHEALRVYPPIWALARSASEDDVLGGCHIPKGALLFFAPYLLHRQPDVWPEPEVFRPERWLDPAQRPKSRCAFMPFSTGPRKCIGDGFALLEGTLLLATLLQRVRLSLAQSEVAPEYVFTMRPRGGVRVVASLA